MIEVEMNTTGRLHDIQILMLEIGVHVPIAIELDPHHCVAVNDENYRPFLVPHTVWVYKREPGTVAISVRLPT